MPKALIKMAKKRRSGGKKNGGAVGDEDEQQSEGSFESETSSMISNGSVVRSERTAADEGHHPVEFLESMELLSEKR